jgi:hypothetical protein
VKLTLPCAPFFGGDAQDVPGEICLFVSPEAVFPDTEAPPETLLATPRSQPWQNGARSASTRECAFICGS